MNHRFALLVPASLALAACGEPASAPDEPAPRDGPGQAIAESHAAPDRAPPALVSETEKGETGARNVLLSFARAIELRAFDAAYAMLGDAARQGMTRAEFAALFDGLGEITVAVPEGRMEGAAGSLYYEVPITITGGGGDGLTGTTVLRRVNDVPGASPEQLRWHIERFEVAPG